MRAHVTKKILSEGLGLLERVIPSRSSNPLLTSLKVEASAEGLTLSGTNLEIDLSCFVPAEVQDPQNLVVPAHLFAQIVRNLGGELVELELAGNELAVRAGGSDFKLQIGDFDAYPPLSFPNHADVSLDAAELSRALGSVRYAASNEAFQAVFRGIKLELAGNELAVRAGGSDFKLQIGDFDAYPPLSFPNHADVSLDAAELSRALGSVRYAASNEAFQAVFRGIKLEHRQESARVVASDGYRVALRDFPANGDGRNLIIPARSADELIRVLKDGEARFTYGEGMLSVTTERVRMNLKLLDGEFPDYERVIPKDIRLQVTLPATALKEAVGRVAVLADKNANNRVEFLVSEGKLRLAAEGDYGRAQDTLDVVQGGMEPAMSLAFNARHVLDALGPIEGEAELLFSGSTSPAIFRASGGGGYMAVMVTLRV